LGRNNAGEETSFLASQVLLFLFFGAQASPRGKEDRSGSSSHCSDGVRWQRSLLEGRNWKHVLKCVSCWKERLVMLHREDGALLLGEENMAVPLSC